MKEIYIRIREVKEIMGEALKTYEQKTKKIAPTTLLPLHQGCEGEMITLGFGNIMLPTQGYEKGNAFYTFRDPETRSIQGGYFSSMPERIITLETIHTRDTDLLLRHLCSERGIVDAEEVMKTRRRGEWDFFNATKSLDAKMIEEVLKKKKILE